MMMGNPGLLQELPDIAALLSEAGGDGAQSAAADCTLAGLNTMADFVLNHRLAQGTLSSVVGGLDSTGLQEGPEATCHLEQRLAGADRLGSRCSLAPPVAQLHHPLQQALKGLADRPGALSQGGPVDRSLLVAVPVAKQLPLQLQQLGSELSPGARPFGDGGEITDQVRSAQLTLLLEEVVVGREAIAHHDPAQAVAQQFHGRCR